MESQSTQDRETSAQETAQVICECVNNLLTDVESVALQLEDETITTPQSRNVLQFLRHCVDAFPECYVTFVPTDKIKPSTITEQQRKNSLAKDFTSWIFSRLFRLLAAPGCLLLHTESLSVITAILKLIRTNDWSFYRKLVSEVIGLYEDLIEIGQSYFEHEEDAHFFERPISCNRFQERIVDSEEIDAMPPKMIEINEYLNVQYLIKATCTILLDGCLYIQQFMADMMVKMYALTFQTIEMSDLSLIQASLKLLNGMAEVDHSLDSFLFSKYVVLVNTVTMFLLEDVTLINVWLPCLKSAMSIILSRDLDNDIAQLMSKKMLMVLKSDKKELQDLAYEIFSDLLSKHFHLLQEDSHAVLKDCINSIGCMSLSKSCTRFLNICISEQKCPMEWCIMKLFEVKLRDLLSNLKKAKSTLQCCLQIGGINSVLKYLIKLNETDELKVLFQSINIFSDVNTVLISFMEETSSKNITSETLLRSISCVLDLMLNSYKLSKLLQSNGNDALFTKCLEICSVPWLQSIDPPWFDFKPVEFNEEQLLRIHYKLRNILLTKVIGKSLKLLALLGKHFKCKTWLSHVFRNAMSNTDIAIKIKAIQNFPVFLCYVGECCFSMINEEVVTLTRDVSDEIQNAAGVVLKDLVCIVSGKAEIVFENGKPCLYCHICTGGKLSDLRNESQQILAIFKPFYQYHKHKMSKKFKFIIINMLQVLFSHMNEKDRLSTASLSIWKSCMEFLKDPQYEVRHAFSFKMAEFLICYKTVGMQQLAIDNLAEIFSQASQNKEVMETIVKTMGQVGKLSKGDMLSVMVVSLFNCFVTQNKFIAAVACEQIHEIAKAKQISCQQLFVDHKNQLSDITVKKFFKVLKDGADVHAVTETFFDIAKLFEFNDAKAFLAATCTEMLPKIVLEASPQASVILRLFAKYLQQNRREMMFYNFKYIFSYLVRMIPSNADLAACLRFLQDETDIDLNSLLLSECQSVFNQLILHLSVDREQVFQGFSILAANDTSYKGPKEFRCDADMAVFLHQKLLGVLAFFNSVLTSSPNYEKRIALKSILCLLNIMGPQYLTPVRLKVMAILKLTLRFKDDFPELCCSAWDSFVRNIDVNYLGGLLGQIFATVIPLLDICSEQVADIFTFLIIENRAAMTRYFQDIYYVPDHPALAKVKQVIDNNQVKVQTMKDFKLQISTITKGIRNENEEVQIFALHKICSLFEEKGKYLEELLKNSDAIETSIRDLINTLLHSCRKRNSEIFVLVGRCFGMLGAIDPGRIENSSSDEETDQESINTDFKDLNFAYEMIQKLCRSFLAAGTTRAQDCAAFAIQETLQYYQCTNQKSDKTGYQLWSKFSKSMQEIVYPHLHSKYVNSATYNWSKHHLPIYNSVKGATYKDWTSNWTNYLIFKLLDHECGKVFKPAMSLIKHDLQIALFLLPRVVLHAILTDHVDCVQTDIIAVLESINEGEATGFGKSCAQTVFSVLGFLNNWRKLFTQNLQNNSSPNTPEDVHSVNRFLENIPKDVLALCSFYCGALSRALMYYENFISNQKVELKEHLPFLQKIYYALDEPDGIAGIAAKRNDSTTLNEQIIEHESSGNLRDAVACYERAIQTEPNNVQHHKGFLDCLIHLGQLNNALMDVSGVVDKRPEWLSELQPYQAEVAWRLGQWETLSTVVQKENVKNDWSNSLGRLLLYTKDKNENKFQETLSSVRREETKSLLSASLESGGYQRAYPSIIRLHMLSDVERFSKFHFKKSTTEGDEDSHLGILREFDHRLELMEASFKSRESVLNLRRVLLNFLNNSEKLQHEKDSGWLKTAKIARKDGLFQTAYSALLNVIENNQPDILMEKANWYAYQKNLHNALLTLQNNTPFIQQTNSQERNQHYAAKISLSKAQWMEETECEAAEPVLAQYKDAVEKRHDWEKGHFCLAKYYEKLMNAWEEDGRKSGRKDDFIRFVLKHYGMSLQFGSKFIYQSMPRLLTLWLDFGHDANQIIEGNGRQSDKSKYKDKLQKLNDEILKLSSRLPPYQFLTAISQLVSRICHSNFNVWKILKGIICQIFTVYKHQSIWHMVAVYKSSIQMRSERCKEIFHEVCSKDPSLKMFIQHSLELTDQLLEVCNRRCGQKGNKLSMQADFPGLVALFNNPDFSEIMLPLQTTLTVQLPSGPDPQQQHNPFSDNLPMITGVEDLVDVLSSLQKPKKISIKASNGCSYTLMCKPKDDLRKDNRLMEFNSLVNKLLLRDPDCRRRKLHIRTYAVVPLNEECGLLEWVQNTSGLRYILNKIYKEKGLAVKVTELKQLYEPMANASVTNKIDIFTNKILPRFPPVFQEWFLTTFPDPTKWYTARLAYCRTSAVMSMVGYTLGLGDRHGENILFDSASGDCVHVDFNCLFNKGETFDCPEKVPFRLTNNMVHAMGPLGYEGIFRKSSEITMKVMREQRDSFLSVLNTFLHDPLVEWKKEARRKGANESSNEMALKILKNVENRLKGYISSTMIHLPLSIEGQVHQLIKESTDMENLAQMYIGWAAYM